MNLETKDIIKEEIEHKIKSCLNEIQNYLEIELNKSKETLLNQWLEITRLNNIIDELEKWLNHSIESINEKLKEDKEEIKVENGICKNMNDYQILRLKTFRTKMNEVLDKLKDLKENK